MIPSADLVAAVTHALRAPSVHNSQPWRWRIGHQAVELHADWNRHLAGTDPDGRDLVLSCGAALHHLRVALAAAGHAVAVDRLPDPDNAHHLATVTLRPGPADGVDAALFPAIRRRYTDRRRTADEPVPAYQVRALTQQARRNGVLLFPADDSRTRQRLTEALTEAARRQRYAPGYAAELQVWTRRYSGGRDGIPAANRTPTAASPLRPFPRGTLTEPPARPGHTAVDDAAELLVIATAHDTTLDWLRAGEATSAVLLAATRMGLATTPLSQGVEVSAVRDAIQRDILHIPEHPQLVVRVGHRAPGATEPADSPRRDLRTVLLPS